MTYDPAFMNTASCRSAITFIDGDKGILEYRGYPIEQLAEKSTYLEIAYLLLNGELPTKDAARRVGRHRSPTTRSLNENIKKLIDGSTTTPIRWGMLDLDGRRRCRRSIRTPKDIFDEDVAPEADLSAHRQGHHDRGVHLPAQHRHAVRLSGQRPLVHRQLPQHDVQDDGGEVHSRTPCSSARSTSSSSCTPTTSRTARPTRCAPSAARTSIRTRRLAAAAAALYGPLHGGANEAVLRMLNEIGSIDNVPDFIKRVKRGEAAPDGLRPPRLQELRPAREASSSRSPYEVFEVTGKNPLLDIAARAGADRARGRVLRQAEALSERRLLLGPHLPGHALPDGHVHGALRHPARLGLARAVAGDARRLRSEDRPPAADLHSAPRTRDYVAISERG